MKINANMYKVTMQNGTELLVAAVTEAQAEDHTYCAVGCIRYGNVEKVHQLASPVFCLCEK